MSSFIRSHVKFGFIAALLIISLTLPAGLLLPSPALAAGGTFPDSPFNGMQITYSISGATITDTQDTPGFTTSRSLKGTLGSGQLALSGSVSQGSGWGAQCSVRVWAGDQSKEQVISLTTPKSGADTESFNLAVTIPKGATSGGFSISMTGDYNAGSRGLTVSGSFGASSSATSATTTATTSQEPPPGPLADKLPEADWSNLDSVHMKYIDKVEGQSIYVSADPVDIPPSQRKWVKIEPGEYSKSKMIKLGEGWTVRVPPGSETRIKTASGMLSWVKERSWYDTTIYRPTWSDEWKQQKAIYGRLWQGISNFYFPKNADKARELGIDLNHTHTGIKGTNLVLEASEDADTIKVIEGQVEVYNYASGATVTLNPGQQVTSGEEDLGEITTFDIADEKAGWASFYDDLSGTAASDGIKKLFPFSLSKLKCPIMAAYGVEDNRQLSLLREFRDSFLASSEQGRAFINAYYRFGPVAAAILDASEPLRLLARYAVLEPVVFALEQSRPAWKL